MLIILFVIFVLCFILESCIPGWKLPKVSTWPLRVILVNIIQLGIVLLAGITWEKWLSSKSIFHLGSSASPILGGITGYFIATFIFYWWHRWRHQNDFLWVAFHQIHHSPQRIEVITSFYKHPIEMIVNSIIGSLLVYAFLGLTTSGGAVYTFCTAIGEFFYHTNIRTPRWVGYFFQRPEMHRIHHQYMRHRNNYGDITWWDMIFRTYDNPPNFTAKCGFDNEKEQRLFSMLRFIDVHRIKKSEAKQ